MGQCAEEFGAQSLGQSRTSLTSAPQQIWPASDKIFNFYYVSSSSSVKQVFKKRSSLGDVSQLAYSVFNNSDMAKKAEHTQRNMQETQMIAMALSAQRQPIRRLPFLGQSGSGRPQGPWVPLQGQCTLCGQKALEEGLWSRCPL